MVMRMPKYDLSKLNDKEFESLGCDIISIITGNRVERFKPGKDSGVDGRFFSTSGGESVIQCKHWYKSGLASLNRHLKNYELVKVRRIKPKCYYLVTSVALSRLPKSVRSCL
jgi:hypothetical protein